MRFLIIGFSLLLSTLSSLRSQSNSASDNNSIKNPYILSQWAGGTFAEEDFELKYQGTYFFFNKLNLRIKRNFEMGFNFSLFGDFSSSTFFKYHFHLNDHISLSPILFLAESYTATFTPPDLYDLNLGFAVTPGINLHISGREKKSGLILNYLYIPRKGTEHEISFLYGTTSKEYVYGVNFYHHSGNLLFNLEWLGFKNYSRDSPSEDINENNLFLTFSYSKNKIVSYDFGFGSRLNNFEKNCEYLCINFLLTLGISVDLVTTFRKKELKNSNY